MYQNPPIAIAIAEGNKVSDEGLKEAIEHFEDFFEEVFLEFIKHGLVEDVNVCDNLGDHLIGNTYVKYSTEEEAQAAMKSLSGRFYGNQQLYMEFSPVTDFKASRCRQYDSGSCGRGGFCNYMHLKYISREFKDSLFDQMYHEHPEYLDKQRKDKEKKKRKRSRSRNLSDYSDCKWFNI